MLWALLMPETSLLPVAQPCAGAVRGYRKCQWACLLCDWASLEFPNPCLCDSSLECPNLLCCDQNSARLRHKSDSRPLEKEVWASKTTALRNTPMHATFKKIKRRLMRSCNFRSTFTEHACSQQLSLTRTHPRHARFHAVQTKSRTQIHTHHSDWNCDLYV